MLETIITIDGPAATGKSTVSRLLAKKLDYRYFDTGLLYRAFTWYVLEKEQTANEATLTKALIPFTTEIVLNFSSGHFCPYSLQGIQLSKELLHEKRVNDFVSRVSSIPAVRQDLGKIQRQQGAAGKMVFVGRDLGSVIFPNALVKIYLTADLSLRAKRRLAELKTPQLPEEVLASLRKRDHIDSTRSCSPLSKAADAYEVDTSDLSIEETMQKILTYREKRLKALRPR